MHLSKRKNIGFMYAAKLTREIEEKKTLIQTFNAESDQEVNKK